LEIKLFLFLPPLIALGTTIFLAFCGERTAAAEAAGDEEEGIAGTAAIADGAEAKGAEAKGAEAKGAEAKGAEAKGAEAKGAEEVGIIDCPTAFTRLIKAVAEA